MKRRTTWLLLLLAVISGVWAFPTVLFHSPLGPAALERKFNAKLPGHLTIGKTTVRVLPRLELLLHGVQWQGPSSSQPAFRHLQIEKVELTLRFPPLFRGNFETEIILLAPHLRVTVQGKHGLGTRTLEYAPAMTSPDKLGLGMIQSLTIANGDFISKRRLPGGEVKRLSVTNINIRTVSLNRDGSLHLKGSTRFLAGRPTLVDLHLETGSLWNPAATERRIEIGSGTANFSGMVMEVRGKLLHKSPFSEVDITLATQAFSVQAFTETLPATAASLPELTADGTELSVLMRGALSPANTIPVRFRLVSPEIIYAKPVRAHITQAIIEGEYNFETLQFSTLRGKVCEGNLTGSGQVALPKPAKPTLHFDLHANNLALDNCDTLPLKPHLTGHLDGDLTLYGTFREQGNTHSPGRIPHWLSGTGEFIIRQGRAQKLQIMQTLGQTLNQFVAIPTMAVPQFSDDNWRKMQASFSFNRGIINISALTMDSDAIQFKASGDIGPNDQLGISGNVILGADFMQLFASKIFYFLTPDGLLVVPLAITGSVGQPRVVFDFGALFYQDTLSQPFKDIPSLIQKEFRDLFLSSKSEI